MRRRRKASAPPPTVVDRRFISDVENLATVAADTAVHLDARGLPELARPLIGALERLGRKRA